MRRWGRYLVVAALGLLTAAPVQAEGFYDHNGSLMRIEQDRNTVRISYENPRPGLVGQGVQPGTVLFEGQLDPNYYLEGLSLIFRQGCRDIDYFVYGQYRPSADFTLTGAAPVLAPSGCQVVDNTYDGSNANLVFSYLRPLQTASGSSNATPPLAEPAAGHGPFCVTGISSALNVRAGPGTQFGIIGSLAAGRCGVAGYNRCQDGWCFVADRSTSPVTLGWAANQYLRTDQ